MNTISPLRCACFALTAICFSSAAIGQTQRPSQRHRLIVMADMGNEPDEEQQMTHLLMYANQVDIEGLVACSGKYLHSARTDWRVKVRPDLFHRLIDGYAKVVDNLAKHESGWPTAQELHEVVKSGTNEYGIDAVQAGKSNEASKLIEASILKDDHRKLYIVGNAGTNTLAQALVDLGATRKSAEMDALCERIIVFENGAQDNSGAWIMNRFPKIAWHRSNHQTYAYGGPGKSDAVSGPYTWEPYERTAIGQNQWATEHIMEGHGALGDLYPSRKMGKKFHFIEGGGTVPWMGLVNQGLTDPEHLDWGGWSGRFSSERHENVFSRHKDIRSDEEKYGSFTMFEADSEQEEWSDPVHGETFNDRHVPVWRFRRAMFNEFQSRMDWCVKEFENANHPPQATLNGDSTDSILHISAKPGSRLSFTAKGSVDPDNDPLKFRWWFYSQAGKRTCDQLVPIESSTTDSNVIEQIVVTVPRRAAGKELHLILAVWDRSDVVPLVDYRRAVIEVE